jgi:hypothetical protein
MFCEGRRNVHGTTWNVVRNVAALQFNLEIATDKGMNADSTTTISPSHTYTPKHTHTTQRLLEVSFLLLLLSAASNKRTHSTPKILHHTHHLTIKND